MKIKRRRTSLLKRLGLVLTWLGVFALMIPSSEHFPSPSYVLLPLGVLMYSIAWLRRE